MKVVLRNKKNGHFFKGPAVWTEDRREAFIFRDSAAAREFYLKHYIPDVQIVSADEVADGESTPG